MHYNREEGNGPLASWQISESLAQFGLLWVFRVWPKATIHKLPIAHGEGTEVSYDQQGIHHLDTYKLFAWLFAPWAFGREPHFQLSCTRFKVEYIFFSWFY